MDIIMSVLPETYLLAWRPVRLCIKIHGLKEEHQSMVKYKNTNNMHNLDTVCHQLTILLCQSFVGLVLQPCYDF